jgi:hypothetical protein
MSFRRTLAVALLCLPLPHALAAEDGSAPTVKWPLPWQAGTTLEYAEENLTVNGLDKLERTRTTSITTVRISEVLADGFVQTWTSHDSRYEVLEGDKPDEQDIRALIEGMQDVALEVRLDDAGTYTGLRNLEAITPRLRKALRPRLDWLLEAQLAQVPQAKREQARKAATAQVDGFLDRMLAPQALEVMLARNIQWYNGFPGLDIEPGQDYEVKTDLPNPLGGEAFPVTVTFSLSAPEDDPDHLYVVFEQRVDRDNAGPLVIAMVESLYGQRLLDKEKSLDLSIVDAGMFAVQRATGVPEMFEATRTVQMGDKRKIERHRLRLLNGDHGHEWVADEFSADPGIGAGVAVGD